MLPELRTTGKDLASGHAGLLGPLLRLPRPPTDTQGPDQRQVSASTHPLQMQLPEFAQSLLALLGGQLLRRREGLLLLCAVRQHLRQGGTAVGRAGAASPGAAQADSPTGRAGPDRPRRAHTADPDSTVSTPPCPSTQASPPPLAPVGPCQSPHEIPWVEPAALTFSVRTAAAITTLSFLLPATTQHFRRPSDSY